MRTGRPLPVECCKRKNLFDAVSMVGLFSSSKALICLQAHMYRCPTDAHLGISECAQAGETISWRTQSKVPVSDSDRRRRAGGKLASANSSWVSKPSFWVISQGKSGGILASLSAS